MSELTEFEEEIWEHEITHLLGGLPAIEPPPGFFARAIDHRPMFAGRTVLGLGVSASLFLAVAVVIGVLDREPVVPPLESLAARHSAVAALVSGATLAEDSTFETVDSASPPVSLSDDFEEAAFFVADDLSQSVYAKREDAVSVFSQPGDVDWSKLPAEGMETVDGSRAWIDPVNKIMVIESADSTVTIVGLSSSELTLTVDWLPGSSSGVVERLRAAASAVSAELGFPDLD